MILFPMKIDHIAKICGCYIASYLLFHIISINYGYYMSDLFSEMRSDQLIRVICFTIIFYCYAVFQLIRVLEISFMLDRFSNGISRIIGITTVSLSIIYTFSNYQEIFQFNLVWAQRATVLCCIILIERHWWRK